MKASLTPHTVNPILTLLLPTAANHNTTNTASNNSTANNSNTASNSTASPSINSHMAGGHHKANMVTTSTVNRDNTGNNNPTANKVNTGQPHNMVATVVRLSRKGVMAPHQRMDMINMVRVGMVVSMGRKGKMERRRRIRKGGCWVDLRLGVRRARRAGC